MRHQTFIPIALAFTLIQKSLSFSPAATRDASRMTTLSRPARGRLLVLDNAKNSNKHITSRQGLWRIYSQDDKQVAEDPEKPVIVRGFDQDEISDQAWEDIEESEPPKLVVMKELLGINVFTYILAGLIVVFLTANFVLGPGWLGQAIGMKGTGTFTDVSPSLPDTVDLNDPNFLL